ncbi:hypothetical protein PENDEC_c005G06524 [Penicillium decumbens]|uniref:histidine kinase n=1 Tax=Penicillium decumbens TaxID=69771 RepID=A0A1V6PH89_PENDC|nr:hypothetical protein PENDEC_c005G06524 [Penicillium decumbens]
MKSAASLDGNVTAKELADMLPTGIAIVNHRDESVFVNRRFRELMTCHNAKSFGCWSQSIHPEDYDEVEDAYIRALRSKTALRIEYRTRSQMTLWRALVLAPLDEEDISRLELSEGGFICTITDITLEKTAELSQKKIAEEAQERKEQQERFIDMISHEIRNPLSAILHCTEDILQAVRDGDTGQVSLADISQAAETISFCVAHQKKIVDDVLTFSKLDASMVTLSPERVQPRRHLANSMAIFRPELRKHNIQFEYKLDHSYSEYGIEWVLADLDRISQVLINLVSNAIKFTARSEGTRKIRVSMGASPDRPTTYPPNVVFFKSDEATLRLDATTAPEWGNGQVAYIMVAVKDTGIGISEQAQKRLFERFNQATPRTQSVYGGSGLGLNVSRKLCHLHGGEIGVGSKEGEGSTFGFFFEVRRSIPPLDDNRPSYDGLKIEELCAGIQALSNDATGSNQRTKSPEISESPPVTHVEEVVRGAPKDERYKHTSEIAHNIGPGESVVSNGRSAYPHDNKASLSKSQSSEASRDEIKPSKPNTRHVLVVEDNVINRQILSRKLQALGLNVSEATNGYEALDAVQRNHFDCILMDQEMPEMDGISATLAIRELESSTRTHVPILGVTANVRAAQQADMLDAGMDDIIHKPYRTNDLFEKINQLMILVSKERRQSITLPSHNT